MIGTGAAILGSAVIGGGLSAWSSNKAGKTQAKYAGAALAEQRAARAEGRADLAPYMETGANATSTLGRIFGVHPDGNGLPFSPEVYEAYKRTPGYQFMVGEGTDALTHKAASAGGLQSGNFMRDLAKFRQGLASTTFQSDYVNPLFRLAGMGQNAASTLAGQGQGYAQMAGDALGNKGQALASGQVGMTNAINEGLGSYVNNSMMMEQMKRVPQQSTAYASLPQGWSTSVQPALPYG